MLSSRLSSRSTRVLTQTLLQKTSLSLSIQNQFLNSLINRHFSSLPYHLVVGMPALSPTMEAGTISSWKVSEGQSFSAGESLAEIETDKATIDFEAQDDGVVAKILVNGGDGKEIKVGVPIMVTVEEEDHVGAFKDFVVESSNGDDSASSTSNSKDDLGTVQESKF
jgi:pyruvate/2-oxoglutarate dehydrogenase complex dihydrolipoamide acyltransferase (E2) component